VVGSEFYVGPDSAPDTFRLVTLLGGGGEGEVWKSELSLSANGRGTRAVKILPARPGEETRMQRIKHLLTTLSHPGLVRVTDVFVGPRMHRAGLADPATRQGYVAMELIEGVTLREWCDETPDASASERIRKLRTVAAALDHMHSGVSTAVPVAHGDVKPSNIVVRPDGGTVLVDLGLTRLADATGIAGRSAPYAAPELRRPGALPSPEADRFAFAVTTAQVLAGQPVPVGQDGWLDRDALEVLLHTSQITARRHVLINRILDAVTRAPDDRPTPLLDWLGSLADVATSRGTGGPGEVPDASTMRSLSRPGTWPTGTPVPAPSPGPNRIVPGPHPTQRPPAIPGETGAHRGPVRPRVGRWLIAAAAGMVIVLVFAVILVRDRSEEPARDSPLGPGISTGPSSSPSTSVTPSISVTPSTPSATSASPPTPPTSTTPAIRNQGSPVQLQRHGTGIDLDALDPNWGTHSSAGQDLELPSEYGLETVSTATIKELPEDLPLSYESCRSQTGFVSHISWQKMRQGSRYCVFTSEDRYAALEIVTLGTWQYSGVPSVSFKIIAWERPGGGPSARAS
jgi:serine/threonine protein kinase